jgi:hypothetical protein
MVTEHVIALIRVFMFYCSMRYYPHMQDTGGFFVAVLEKTGTTDVPESVNSKEEGVTETKEVTMTEASESKEQTAKGNN